MHELFYGSHMNEVVVLKDGLRKLGRQHDAMPANILAAVQSSGNVLEFLGKLDEATLKAHNARVYYMEYPASKQDRQLKTDERTGVELTNLYDKYQEMLRREVQPTGAYIAELRRKEKYRHPLDGHWVKTTLHRDLKDFVGADRAELMPYWCDVLPARDLTNWDTKLVVGIAS
eukprot:SAG22_NODE_3790_length_1530_cov_1.915444_3_plen_173_part_00